MQISNKFKKIIFKTVITIAVFECFYLCVLPFSLNKLLESEKIKNFILEKTKIETEFDTLNIKTRITPSVLVKAKKIAVKDKYGNEFVNTQNINAEIRLFPLLKKELNLKSITAETITLNINKNDSGNFNFENLISKDKTKKRFSFSKNNTALAVKNLKIDYTDNATDKKTALDGSNIFLKSKKNKIEATVNLKFFSDNKVIGEAAFEGEIKTPLKKEHLNKFLKCNCNIYNLNLSDIMPSLIPYLNLPSNQIEGYIDYLQLNAEQNENDETQIVINTKFNDLKYGQKDWSDNIYANGEHTLNTSLILKNNEIKATSANLRAKDLNIKADGTIEFKNKPVLNINAEVENSKAENIVPLLPPNLPVEYKTTGKIKKYGVYGDVNGKINIKGEVPRPDITGYMSGKNVHIDDKSLHKLYKGTVDIVFKKRTLDMDILIEFLNNQKATINGYTYMYREGVNHVKVKTTNNIDYPLAQKIVIPVSKVFNFQLGPIPEMDIMSGKGIIDLDIQGSIDFVNIKGISSFKNAKLTYNGLFGVIEDIDGEVTYNGDIINFKSKNLRLKNNKVNVDGNVQINKNLEFNISGKSAEAKDVLELINKSELLKDVQDGLKIITSADGKIDLFTNIKANIVPVPFGMPPLPPDEAFTDMKVKGFVNLNNNECYFDGFYTPITDIKGRVDFTETLVTIDKLTGISGTSPLVISGKIINDIETKIPYVDLTVTSEAVNLKDTVRFLTKSYMYPEGYPDLSFLYQTDAKHDLYFKYRAKSIDFLTDKAFAVMNVIPSDGENSVKFNSGKVVMDKATVKVNNIIGEILNSPVTINGEVNKVDTLNPLYNLKIVADDIDISKLNNKEPEILPEEIKQILNAYSDYSGRLKVNLLTQDNKISGKLGISGLKFKHKETNTPVIFDDFEIKTENDNLHLNNISAQISDMPIFANFNVYDVYNKAEMQGNITAKLTQGFIDEYLPKELSGKLKVFGDINFSGRINGNINNYTVIPKLTFNKDSDISYDGTNLGMRTNKRELTGNIQITKNEINIKNLDYIKYISSQNNKVYPIIFAQMQGILEQNKEKQYFPKEIAIRTNQNLSARILNIFLKNQIFTQGTFNCDIKYISDIKNKTAKIIGTADCRSLNIPLFDTSIKNIKIIGDNENINLKMFGFLSDSKININSLLKNNLLGKIKVEALNIHADKINNNTLLENLSKAHISINQNNNIKHTDLSGISIDNGHLSINELVINSLSAKNLTADFSIDKNGIFKSDNLTLAVGEGYLNGRTAYNLNDCALEGNFEINNVDADYIAETLFYGKNQVSGNANGKLYLKTKGTTDKEIIKNLEGFVFFDIADGRMPKLGSLEYLLRAGNIIKSGITGFSINNILEILNLVKTGHFSNISGSCNIKEGVAKDIEIYSRGENLSLYIHGDYDINSTQADLEVLGNLSKQISTIFGTVGNTSLNTFFKLIPGISLLDFGRKDIIENVEKIPLFTNGNYEYRTFQAIINGDINKSDYVQSFKWIKQ